MDLDTHTHTPMLRCWERCEVKSTESRESRHTNKYVTWTLIRNGRHTKWLVTVWLFDVRHRKTSFIYWFLESIVLIEVEMQSRFIFYLIEAQTVLFYNVSTTFEIDLKKCCVNRLESSDADCDHTNRNRSTMHQRTIERTDHMALAFRFLCSPSSAKRRKLLCVCV